jgi:hypothetical protein
MNITYYAAPLNMFQNSTKLSLPQIMRVIEKESIMKAYYKTNQDKLKAKSKAVYKKKREQKLSVLVSV